MVAFIGGPEMPCPVVSLPRAARCLGFRAAPQQPPRGIARARNKRAVGPEPDRDDSQSQAAHRHFDDAAEWDQFVQEATGLSPPADKSGSRGQPSSQELGAELVQQDAAEVQSRGRRRTRQLLGRKAAEELGAVEAGALPSAEASAPRSKQVPAAARRPPMQAAREDFWNEAPKLQQQATEGTGFSRAQQLGRQTAVDAEEAQEWWEQLERETEEAFAEDDSPPPTDGPPDIVVLRHGPEPKPGPEPTPAPRPPPAPAPAALSMPPSQQAAHTDSAAAHTPNKPAQQPPTAPIPAIPPVASAEAHARARQQQRPLPAIAYLARSQPPPPPPPPSASNRQPLCSADQTASPSPAAPSPPRSPPQPSSPSTPSAPLTARPLVRQSVPAPPAPPSPTLSPATLSEAIARHLSEGSSPTSGRPLSVLPPTQQRSAPVQPPVPLPQGGVQGRRGPEEAGRLPWQKQRTEGDRPGAGAGSDLDFFSQEAFPDIGAAEELVAGLRGMGISSPSHIQAGAFQPVLSGKRDLVIADHAGSGKTLAYLAPLAQKLMEQERALQPSQPPRSPRVIVVTPTAELCAQVTQVAKALAKGIPFRSSSITGNHKWRTQADALKQGQDIVVGTPGRLLEHVKAGNLDLWACHTMVLDEADVLLSEAADFFEQVEPLRQALPEGARMLLVTATMPEPIWLQVQAKLPEVQTCLGPRLHRPAPGVVERVVDCSGGEEINEDTGFERKAEQLLGLMREHPSSRTMIFCNKIETCRKVENYLKRHAEAQQQGVRRQQGARQQQSPGPLTVLPYHAAIDAKLRPSNLQAFMAPPGSAPMALVCTDRASRGLDSAACGHVVLFDLPRDPSEYVRRAGRTARGTSEGGTVSILVLGRQLKVARQIVARNERQLPIHRLPELPY